MKRTARRAAFFLALSFVFMGCAGPRPPVLFTQTQDGRTMEVGHGRDFNVALPENPTTGYLWAVESADPAKIRQVGESEYEESGCGLVGSGGIRRWYFKAVGRGQTTLRMVYRRPWVKDEPPAETYTLHLKIR